MSFTKKVAQAKMLPPNMEKESQGYSFLFLFPNMFWVRHLTILLWHEVGKGQNYG